MTENEANVEEGVEETVMLTRRDRRRGASARPDAGPGPHGVPRAGVEPSVEQTEQSAVPTDDADELDESTIIVDRSARADVPEESVIAPEQDPDEVDESTVIVDRSVPTASSPEPDEDQPDAPSTDEHEDAGEATVVVSRAPRRPWGRSKPAATEAEPPAEAVPTVESFERPTDAPTPAIYKPRPAPAGPKAPPVISGAAAPTRIEDPERPSVAKQAQRWGLYTMVAFGAACVVSLAGLVGVGFLVFG